MKVYKKQLIILEQQYKTMEILKTKLPEVLLIKPKVFKDNRGYFFESYNKKIFEENAYNYSFIQDNESFSQYGVIRGLHYQLSPYAQTKLIRVIQGKIYDVAVDIRQGSPTFGQWVGYELTAENKSQLLIPKGFAHGFSVLSETAIIQYKCDEFYHPESERGIAFNDPELNIDWRVPIENAIISSKDKVLPNLNEADFNFIYKI